MIFSWGWQTLHWLKVKVQRAALMYSYGGEREREGEGERERQRDRETERGRESTHLRRRKTNM